VVLMGLVITTHTRSFGTRAISPLFHSCECEVELSVGFMGIVLTQLWCFVRSLVLGNWFVRRTFGGLLYEFCQTVIDCNEIYILFAIFKAFFLPSSKPTSETLIPMMISIFHAPKEESKSSSSSGDSL
jgi:hypothetical protein